MAEVPVSELRKSISEMLEGADLSALSSKKVRKQLEEKYGIDFTDRKKEIDNLVMELITPTEKKEEPKGNEEQNGAGSSASPTGSSSSEMEDDDEERNDGDDEELARKLQDEEVRSRSRAVKKSRVSTLSVCLVVNIRTVVSVTCYPDVLPLGPNFTRTRPFGAIAHVQLVLHGSAHAQVAHR
ncbi:hypothetical protein V5799_022605 [Amblyomma americanum]|uniref:DEK-C domain-containing protein n=1 Tax=Amblyomma americanum TaxID=6943 RepID=A0AAQ4FK47_AMBAM